jgi:glycerol-3-phosphate dehydrogenase
LQTQVLIIGGGATGTGLARDLALRGIHCILAERQDLNAGASGANHGLLHSGARYVAGDPVSAVQCRIENDLLKKSAPQCIEDTKGLFVAVEGDDEEYVADFPALCAASGISALSLTPCEARDREPLLTDKVIAAFEVNDASIDPFRLSFENIHHAMSLGAEFLHHCEITGFETTGGLIRGAKVLDTSSGKEWFIEVEQVINAAGAWAGRVAELAGASISILYSKGTLLVTGHRLSHRGINRLRSPSDGDILMPGGTVSILGTTSVRVESLDDIRPTVAEVDLIVEQGKAMLPCLEDTRFIRAFTGVRPLIAQAGGSDDDRNVSRGFSLLDHLSDGLENFVTIAGGKLTTFRLMAEKAGDLVARRLGNTMPCLTGIEPLPASSVCRWTEPGSSPRKWLESGKQEGLLLCECEMVSSSTVDSVSKCLQEGRSRPNLKAISLRSRIGKGPCQGTFCGAQVTAYLYDRGLLKGDEGLIDLKEFLGERWKGTRPILWDMALAQAELQEAVYCGFFCLELSPLDEKPFECLR